jgi:hypothetical protein
MATHLKHVDSAMLTVGSPAQVQRNSFCALPIRAPALVWPAGVPGLLPGAQFDPNP